MARIGLALGSGAAKGWAHIGVLEALQDAGIEPDIVCGCSMGALVGGAYASNALPALKTFAEDLTPRGIVKLLDIGLSGGGVIMGRQIVEMLRSVGFCERIEDCRAPFAAVATNLETGRELWLREGALDEAVRASISIPGVLNPIRVDGHWLADGALVNPVPVSVCRAMGADIIIAVNVNSDAVERFEAPEAQKRSSPEFVSTLVDRAPAFIKDQAAEMLGNLFPPPTVSPGYFDVLMNAINIMQDQITRARLAGDPPHVLVAPRLGDIGPMEFHRAKEAIAEGRASMEEALPALKRHL
jgi:NTE family protein